MSLRAAINVEKLDVKTQNVLVNTNMAITAEQPLTSTLQCESKRSWPRFRIKKQKTNWHSKPQWNTVVWNFQVFQGFDLSYRCLIFLWIAAYTLLIASNKTVSYLYTFELHELWSKTSHAGKKMAAIGARLTKINCHFISSCLSLVSYWQEYWVVVLPVWVQVCLRRLGAHTPR